MKQADARALKDARLLRVVAARDAASTPGAADLADMVGCLAEQNRDAWIFREDAFLTHVQHDLIDAEDGTLVLGDLRLRLDSAITTDDDGFDFVVDGVVHLINAADTYGAGYDALDEIDRLLDDPYITAVLVRVDGGEPVQIERGRITTRGPDVPALIIAPLDVSIPFHAIGHRGLIRRGEEMLVLGLDGTTVAMTPVVG